MLFFIALALNDPYGYDVQDIRLNRMSAKAALSVLNAYSCNALSLQDAVHAVEEPPEWLRNPLRPPQVKDPERFNFGRFAGFIIKSFTHRRSAIPLLLYTMWTALIVFGTWRLSLAGLLQEPNPKNCFWWCLYIPLEASTANYVGLGVFLFLGFWVNDAYSRYWKGLFQWNVVIRSNLLDAASRVCSICRQGLWHPGDRERFLSFLAAVPYVAKAHLGQSSDLSQVADMLSPRDLTAVQQAENPVVYCLNVINGYMNSAECEDAGTLQYGKSPFRLASRSMFYSLWRIEMGVVSCICIRDFPISFSFTVHMKIFAVFWLMLLPLTSVQKQGFPSFVVLLPIAYSILNLILCGEEIVNPFGNHDHDLELTLFCNEIKAAVHNIYQTTLPGPQALVHSSEYSHEQFHPTTGPSSYKSSAYSTPPDETVDSGLQQMQRALNTTYRKTLTFRGFLKVARKSLPSVPMRVFMSLLLWTVAAVFASYGLSFTWDEERRNECRGWCSPINVSGFVLVKTGFALFMLLTFRANNAIGRYEDGAKLIFDLHVELRTLALEIVSSFRNGNWHENDIERMVAHVIQIPLSLRDMFLGVEQGSPEAREGFLSDEDRETFENSPKSIFHLLNVLDGYITTMDCVDPSQPVKAASKLDPTCTFSMLNRLSRIKQNIWAAEGLKRFPVVESYTNHQRLFAGVWLVLLPLSLTTTTGFFSILWAPIITIGVLGLEQVSTDLMDPFGKDATDLKVEELCEEIADDILEGVRSVGWECEHHTASTGPPQEPFLTYSLRGQSVRISNQLYHFQKFESTRENFGEGSLPVSNAPKMTMVVPNLFAHLLKSVPWWMIPSVTLWSALSVVLSYITRIDAETVDDKIRWWRSRINSDEKTLSYVSFVGKFLRRHPVLTAHYS